MIYTVTLNPALDKTVEIPSLAVNGVNRITALRTDPGGKGVNVSKVIQKLGGASVAVGLLGGNTGRAIRAALEAMGLQTDFLWVDGETRTNLKIIDPVRHTNTDLNEPGFFVSLAALDALRARLQEKLRPGDLVVLCGSLPQGAPADTYGVWAKACAGAGARVLLDASGPALRHGLQASPYLVKPNREELAELTGAALQTPQEVLRAARAVQRQYGVALAAVSMGGAGALFLSEQKALYAKGLDVPVQSTVGAGDSVVAALAVSLEAGKSIEEAARLAVACGSAAVMCSGTQAAERRDIEALLPRVALRRL